MAASPQRSHALSAAKLTKAAKPVPAVPARPTAVNGSVRRPAGETIEQCVRRSLEQYFADLDGAKPHALHEMVMDAVERPLLAFAMEKCSGNQSVAAELLGINRNTLRKKLIAYGMAK